GRRSHRDSTPGGPESRARRRCDAPPDGAAAQPSGGRQGVMAAKHLHALGEPHGPHAQAATHPIVAGRLRTAFVLTLIVLLSEGIGGVASHSLALLSDAGHVSTDLVALGLAWFAAVRAAKPADAHNTYGYHRTGILAALANAITLILI